MLHFLMRKSVTQSSRRSFLRTAPLAAAAGFALTETSLLAQPSAPPPEPVPFQLFSADKLADAMKQLQSAPGNDNLFQPTELPFTIVLTTEEKKSAKEFEWHEGRDHILQILDGTTVYELGGTPQAPHGSKPSEWNAPSSQNSTTLTLHKGDLLVIPRGTPHRRTTADSVTFYLISTTGK
jgi:mannose-6-phosphate isomerase-like protein (cupin superfamily)